MLSGAARSNELESEVMDEVWRHDGPTTVRAVMDALSRRGAKERAYTTIMTIMRRLDSKRLLSRERDGKADVYSARISRDEYAAARAQAEVGALVDEFGDAALVHFARHIEKLDRKRRDQLRRLARNDTGADGDESRPAELALERLREPERHLGR